MQTERSPNQLFTSVPFDRYGKRQGDVTEKADVYSFGVVLLELMTGRRALSSEGEPLAHWAAAYIHQGRARVDSLIDPQLKVRGNAQQNRDVCSSRTE